MMRFNFPATETPPDYFRFTFPDGTTIKQNHRQDWFNKIEAHYRMNGYEMPLDWKEQAENQLCQLLPPGWCRYDTGETAQPLADARITMGDLFRGMEVLLRIAASPDPLVEQAEADRRAAICSGCAMNAHVPGCAPCMKIPDMVAKIAGARTTKYQHLLQSCLICKCRNEAQAWIKPEILAKGITYGQHLAFKQIEHCWKKDIAPA